MSARRSSLDSERSRGFLRWPTRPQLIALVSSVLVVCLWATSTLDWLVCRRIESLVTARQYEQAESMIAWLRWVGCTRGELLFWEGRLLRKQTRGVESLRQLIAARAAGYDKDRVRRELILLHAQAGNLSPIRREFEVMLADPGPDAAEICEAFVNGALIDGQTELALAILPAWQLQIPADPQPYYARGRVLEHKLDATAAEREYRSAVERDSEHWPARYALGRLLLSQKKAAEALVQSQAACRMRDNAAPRLQVAKCLRALGKNNEAKTILHDLLKSQSEARSKSFIRVGEPESGLPVEMELGLMEVSLQNWEAALPWLERVLLDDPQLIEVRYALATTLRSLGRLDVAQREFERIRLAREAIAEADRLVDEIARRSDLCVAERCRIGELYLKNESRRRGEFWLRDALNRDPNYVPAHRLLAEYYQELARSHPNYADLAERHRRAAGPAVVPSREATPLDSTTERGNP